MECWQELVSPNNTAFVPEVVAVKASNLFCLVDNCVSGHKLYHMLLLYVLLITQIYYYIHLLQVNEVQLKCWLEFQPTPKLMVQHHQLSTFSSQSFPVAGPTISDTFGVSLSISEILLWGNIAIGIGDCYLRVIGIDYWRYFTSIVNIMAI